MGPVDLWSAICRLGQALAGSRRSSKARGKASVVSSSLVGLARPSIPAPVGRRSRLFRSWRLTFGSDSSVVGAVLKLNC